MKESFLALKIRNSCKSLFCICHCQVIFTNAITHSRDVPSLRFKCQRQSALRLCRISCSIWRCALRSSKFQIGFAMLFAVTIVSKYLSGVAVRSRLLSSLPVASVEPVSQMLGRNCSRSFRSYERKSCVSETFSEQSPSLFLQLRKTNHVTKRLIHLYSMTSMRNGFNMSSIACAFRNATPSRCSAGAVGFHGDSRNLGSCLGRSREGFSLKSHSCVIF